MAGRFGEDLKERIRDASDIVDVINGYIPLKRAGANFMALCPFHREKTPSFNVNPTKQIFHCFGCHKGGDVFSFVQEYENLNFIEAAKRLADRANIPWEVADNPEDRQRGQIKEQLYQIHEQLTVRWHKLLTNDAQGEPGRKYLAARGISEEAVSMFRIGFAPNEWSETLNWAKSKNYEESLLETAGLITSKEGSQHFYDRFRNRLMFPIADAQGRVIAFSGRLIDDQEKGGKYVNSPETPIFKKGSVLFGLDKARQAIREENAVIVCEGQLDTISCHVHGIRNTVAPQGTALTASHARILKRYAPEVVLCFDSDGAGQKAIQRSFDDLLASGAAVRVAQMPSPHDPDSYISEHGADAFRQLIGRGPGYFDYLLDYLREQHDAGTDRGRTTIVQSIAEAVNKTQDAVLIDTYAQKTSQLLGVAVEAVRQEFGKKKTIVPQFEADEEEWEEPVEDEFQRPSTLEFWLLKLVVAESENALVEWLLEHLDLAWVQHDTVKRVLLFRFDLVADEQAYEIRDLLESIQEPRAASLITEAATEDREIPNPREQMGDIVLRMRNLYIDSELQRLARGAVDPNDDELARAAHVLELQRLKRQPLELLADA